MKLGPLCALLMRILTWCLGKQVTFKDGHIPDWLCGSRQAIQARPDHPDTVVSPPKGLPINVQQVASTSAFVTRFNN